ncbi:hypothetical protein HanRHA438_Chr17g0807751 [Helianthus annuus]|nr:hypothetical protein HanHA89_Chr17g0701971 [Helianthus annuus]KAJ0632043.1 hypothetical protein HanLR1_Chr17g0660641 [Helianthus annuus]KAJ0635928.1 hypothetical protein HanOQP8_Chr17g0656191 [Helianthus annuus]KAJ0638934.1 hypothetical protein HanHA300_Chr00c0016g0682651 [Helianthus annuus]KAJ0825855.1 hypothetical protein HanRHA438_Chr17g0807751 [Helianthus annuus]
MVAESCDGKTVCLWCGRRGKETAGAIPQAEEDDGMRHSSDEYRVFLGTLRMLTAIVPKDE